MARGLSHNVAEIARRMRRRSGAVSAELTAAARPISRELYAEDQRVLQEDIYSVPIPLKKASDRKLAPSAAVRSKTTKGKHGEWTRTGNLRRSETVTPDGPVVVMRNNAKYAVARHNLGTAGGRQIKSRGIRSVQWQAKAILRQRQGILAARRRAVLRALRAR